MRELPVTQTNFTNEQLAASLVRSWYKLFNDYPSRESIAIILAQKCLECGTKNCFGYNIGNIKAPATGDDTICYSMYHNVFEFIHGKKVIYQPPSPYTWFRAFESLDEGTLFYIQFLQKHYHSAFDAIKVGQVANFVHLLKVNKYFTADEQTYLATVSSYYKSFTKDSFTYDDNSPIIIIENNDIDFTLEMPIGATSDD